MKKTTKGKAFAAMLAVLTVLCSVVLASCDTGMAGSDFLTSIPDLNASTDTSSEDVSLEESTPAGYTKKPEVSGIINITPSEVIIAGNCEENAVVHIKGGKDDVSVVSTDGYFITRTTLINTTVTLLEVTAKVEGKEESLPLSMTAHYSAIAESRQDGMSVTVGKDSHLYFDKMVADYEGTNLLTQTKLRTFKTFVNSRVSALEGRAAGQEVDLIYVLIPDSTSIYDEYLADDIKKETHSTRYQQVSDAIKSTNAIIVDLYDAFKAAKEANDYPIYRVSDSHLTEYGSFIAYTEIMKAFTERFPDAAAHGIDDFTIGSKTTIGGDLVSYLGIDKAIVSETVPTLTPKFSLDIGDDEGKGFVTGKISAAKIYQSATDLSIDVSKEAGTILSRLYFRTGQETLPSVLVYRDEYAAGLTPLLAERFNNSMFALSGDYTINLTDAGRHASGENALVDYVVVIVSESNIESILG